MAKLLSALTKRPAARYAPAMPAPPSPLVDALAHLSLGQLLPEGLCHDAFRVVMAGDATAAQLGALLLGLRARGETVDELVGAVRALRGAMRPLDLGDPDRLVDTCGTGGGAVRTLNISTAAALVAAGAGIPVAKHGNRSFTSRSGSADVLEALGVSVDIDPADAPRILDDAGVVFLFAPHYHPAMRHAAQARRELGVATLMNLVGPLANPASVRRQVVGVADPRHGRLMIEAMRRLGTTRGMVVHAMLGLDEISPMGTTQVWELRDGSVREYLVDPAPLGLASRDLAGVEGGEPSENAGAITSLLESPRGAPSALRAAVLLNAAAAVAVADDHATLMDAVERVRAALDTGAAHERLERLRRAAPAGA